MNELGKRLESEHGIQLGYHPHTKDERWGEPLGVVVFTREIKHDLRSVTKSVVSALVGIANRSGAIRPLDTPLLDYFPSTRTSRCLSDGRSQSATPS